MDPFIPLVAFGSFLFVRYYKCKFLKEEELKEIDDDLSWRITALTNGNYFEAPMDEKVVPFSSIFLGGGISGAKDWQKEVSKTLLSSCPGLAIYNPRRYDFDVTNKSILEEQITWEHDYLRRAKAITFWFVDETLCPITLYELGTWTILSKQTGTKIFVGVSSSYARREDVIVQTRLSNPDIAVAQSLGEMMSLSDYLIQGNSSFVDGDYQKSMQNYSLEIKQNPKSSEAFSKRASCKLKLNDYLGATQDAITSFQLDSSNHVAYFVHGVSSFELEEYESAFNSFSASYKLNPTPTYRIWMRKAEAELSF